MSATKGATKRAIPHAESKPYPRSRKERVMDAELTFGQWLRRNRKAYDLTQAELAVQAGCAIGTLRNSKLTNCALQTAGGGLGERLRHPRG